MLSCLLRCAPVLSVAWFVAAPAWGQAGSAQPPDFREAVQAATKLPRIRSLLVSRRGDLILERYFHGARATTHANVKSVSKSVISALTGIAIARGLLPGVDAPIAPYFPELARPNVDPRKRKITIEDLLTMRSGLQSTSGPYYGAWVRSPNWVRYVLERPLIAAPGERVEYSTGNTHLLSAILTKVTGKSTWAFAQEALGKPLGITLAQWTRDPQGIYFGGNEMSMTPRQMIRFGELYANRGVAGGKQVVPASWIDASFIPRGRSSISEQLYGYGWWIGMMADTPVYFAWGSGGQYIFVIPSLDLVVATTSTVGGGDGYHRQHQAVYDLVERFIVQPVAFSLRAGNF
ncbi:MAG TPA: serine hydrolase [Bryobacteraceae bacterium]|nr:serine hydrolase [Bryobacteraceae bacterium]HPQ16473.1 serine hydrolase [Bryobacteraceae bacterium]HPU72740.1 serine hydrolase [Bryobacteraceae bacterium]